MSSSRSARRRRAAGAARRHPATPAATPSPRARQRSAPRGRGAPAGRTPGRDGGVDAAALLRSSSLVGRPARLGLLVGLGCLCADLVARIVDGHTRPGSTPQGNVGVGLVLGFLVLSLVAYQRTLFRIRRDHPEAWRPGVSFLVGLLGAPLGIGDPAPRPLDRWILRLTALLAVALLPLSLLSPR